MGVLLVVVVVLLVLLVGTRAKDIMVATGCSCCSWF